MVYRLVNTVYVVGVSSAQQDSASINAFACTQTVTQAVRCTHTHTYTYTYTYTGRGMGMDGVRV